MKKNYKMSFNFMFFFLIAVFSIELSAKQYGYLIDDSPVCSIWWAEGVYKIKKDDPVPENVKEEISITSAINEYEPFQIVLRSKEWMDGVEVEVSELIGSQDSRIPPEHITICHVEYVKIETPTDEYGSVGEWPDPLPPYDGPFTLYPYPRENYPLWFTVYVPQGTVSGRYEGTITITYGSWEKEIPLYLQVRKFSLPEETHIRSAFNLSVENIRRYHNLETREELVKVTNMYMQNFKEHRISPFNYINTDFYYIKHKIYGVYWNGGVFVSDSVRSGKRAVKVEDGSVSSNVEVEYTTKISVEPNVPYRLTWYVKIEEEEQQYTVLIKGYNTKGEFLPSKNILAVFTGLKKWEHDTLEIEGFSPKVQSISLHFFPTFRDRIGSFMGTAYFDDIAFGRASGSKNLLRGGDFEMLVENMLVEVDFSQFNIDAQKYLDDLGFNSFDLNISGLGGGSYYSRREGVFAGFKQGSPEYDILFGSYLMQIQAHLEENGWLGKEFIYWFDEPNPKDYPFVREGMKNIHKAAPKLTRFITEHKPGPDIMDVSEISCTVFHRIDPEDVSELIPEGREFWSYLCTVPKGPWVTLFIDHPAINLRIWLWISFKYELTGILVWGVNYWNSTTVFPEGILQNPWEDPMSYESVGYGSPYGKVNYWGNGDGRFLYPPNRHPNKYKAKYICGPVNSVRWEILREGIEDYEYLWLLQNAIKNAGPDQKELVERGKELLELPETLFKNGKEYTKDPLVLLKYREEIASLLDELIR